MQAGQSIKGGVVKSVPSRSGSGWRVPLLTSWALVVVAPAALIVLLAWPLLFTNEPLSGDWLHHLTLIWSQSHEIDTNHHPSFFFNYSHAILYPQFAFYGATIYAIAGTLSLLFGDPIAAYIATYLIGFAAAYGGWYWLARMAGLGRWRAHAPGVLFVTSGYYITLIYGRGDWPEFLAVSMMPLLVASILGVLRAERLRLGSAIALLASAIVFFGSHSLTVVWGSTFLALIGVAVVGCVPNVRRWLTVRAVSRVALLLVPALLVNAWFLLPMIAYEAHTEISHRYLDWRLTVKAFMVVVSASNLFALERVAAVSRNGAFVVALPVLAIAWALVGIAVVVRGGLRNPWTRAVLIFAGGTAAMAVVMTHAALILALPRPYAILQFSYRLDSFVLMGVSATVLAVLAAIGRGVGVRAILGWALVPILVLAIIAATEQAGSSPGYTASRQEAIRPDSKLALGEQGWLDYVDAALPRRPRVRGATELNFPPATLHDDRSTRRVHLQPGQIVYTNIGGGPELVHVTGAAIVGIGPEGNDVLRVDGPASSGAVDSSQRAADAADEGITVGPANGLPIVLGRVISLVAIAFLLALLVVIAIRGGRARGVHHAK